MPAGYCRCCFSSFFVVVLAPVPVVLLLFIIDFSGSGFKFRNYDYLKEIFAKCNILLIHETWLYNFQHEGIGKKKICLQ